MSQELVLHYVWIASWPVHPRNWAYSLSVSRCWIHLSRPCLNRWSSAFKAAATAIHWCSTWLAGQHRGYEVSWQAWQHLNHSWAGLLPSWNTDVTWESHSASRTSLFWIQCICRSIARCVWMCISGFASLWSWCRCLLALLEATSCRLGFSLML